MATIDKLSRISTVASGDVLPVYQQASGDSRGISVGQLATAVGNIATGGLARQIQPFPSKAALVASLPLLSDGFYTVNSDESLSPPQSAQYSVTSGIATLVFKASQSGSDSALRGDLAASPGAGLLGSKRAGLPAAPAILTVAKRLDFGNFDIREFVTTGGNIGTGNDDTPTWASALQQTGIIHGAPGMNCLVSGLTIDVSKSQIDGRGAALSNPGGAGPMLTVVSNGGPEAVNMRALRRLFLNGDGTAGATAIKYLTAAPYVNANMKLEGVTFYNWPTAELFQDNTFCIDHFGCVYSSCGNTGDGAIQSMASGAPNPNLGERLQWFGGQMFNSQGNLFYTTYAATQFFLSGVSLDYNKKIAKLAAGWWFAQGCYLESDRDTDYWFETLAGASASVFYNGGSIVCTGAKPNFEMGKHMSGGVMDLSPDKLYSPADPIKPYLILAPPSSGRAKGRVRSVEGFARDSRNWAGASLGQRLNANPVFNKGSGNLGDWTIGSNTGFGGNPAVTVGAGPDSDNALVLQIQAGSGGNDQFAYCDIPARPGQNAGVSYMVKTNNVSAGFHCRVQALDALGTVLADQNGDVGFNLFNAGAPLPTVYTQMRNSLRDLPPGTVKARIYFDTAGGTQPTYAVSIAQAYAGTY